jgi:hypothetical protein
VYQPGAIWSMQLELVVGPDEDERLIVAIAAYTVSDA